METKANFDLKLAISEVLFGLNDNSKIEDELGDYYYLKQVDHHNVKKEELNLTEKFRVLKNASIRSQNSNKNNEITDGLNEFEFENGLEKLQNSSNYHLLRKRNHIQVAAVCAHAAYFVGTANRIKRNIENIKNGIRSQPKSNLLLNEMKKDPGLKIGIIGCGRIGYQLARSFLEFSEVYPNEMEISTRQPDSLGFFANQNIKCYFDNAQVARFAEILFLCVLPTQLGMVIDEIKNHLNQHCTVYSVIRTETEVNLKNLLYWTPKTIAIIKPTYAINDKTLKSKWDYTIDTIENMKSLELIESLNPFAEHQKSALYVNDSFKCALIYALLNVCSTYKLTKEQSLTALTNYVFFSPNKLIHLEERYFSEPTKDPFFKFFNMLDFPTKESTLESMLKKSSNGLNNALFTNFNNFFLELANYRKNE